MTNTRGIHLHRHTVAESDWCFEALPESLRHYLQYDCTERLSPVQAFQEISGGFSAREVHANMQSFCRREAIRLYGPDYPADLAGKPLKR